MSQSQIPAEGAPQSHTTPNPRRPRRGRFGTFTPRTIAAPIAAFTMAVLLYTYSVTSISAAKRNAALHRHADGGQLDMRRESLRRHGVLDQVEGTKGVELFRNARAPAANSTSTSTSTSTAVGAGAGAGTTNSSAPTPVPEAVHGPDLSSPPPPPPEQKQTKNAPTGEEAVRGSGAGGQQPERAARTEVEGGLEGWKGEGGRGRFRGPPPPSA